MRSLVSITGYLKASAVPGAARIRRCCRSFRDDRRGVAMIVFAVAFPVLLLAGGGAIDVQRATGAHAQLQRAADAAALASAVHDGTEAEKEAVALGYLQANADPSLNDLEISDYGYDSDNNTHSLSATASVGTFFLGVVGIDALTVSVEAETTLDIPDIEIALVFDLSGSMNTNGRFPAAKAAATALIDDLFTDPLFAGKVKASLVPFAGYVSLDAADAAQIAGPPADQAEIDRRAAEGFCPQERGGTLSASLAPPSAGFFNRSGPRDDGWGPASCADTRSVVPLTDDAGALKLTIDALGMDTTTTLLDALLWGARTLDPGWNPHWTGLDAQAFGDDVVKAVLLLTDGESTWWPLNDNGIVLDQAAYDAVCADVGAKFALFGVGFEVNSAGETSLQRCAGLANGVYRKAEGEEELTDALLEAARSLLTLRLSK